MTTPPDVTIEIDGRTLTLQPTNRSWRTVGDDYDIFEGETLLTTADPRDGLPTEDELRAFLAPRRQALVELMTSHSIIPGNDYQYDDDYELLWGTEPIGRWVAVYGDETYNQIHVCEDLQEALDSLGSIIYEEYCNVPEGVYDLDNRTMLAIKSTISLRDPLDS